MNRFEVLIFLATKIERKTGRAVACFLLSLFPILPALALNPDQHISQYAHSAWRTKDGAFTADPRRLAQTADGYLWLGTCAGLWHFDGVRFVQWVPPEGQQLPSSCITALLATPDGGLWIGTVVGLSRWKDGYLTNYVNDKGIVPAIVQARDGTIWILKVSSTPGLGPLCEVARGGMHCHGEEDGIPANDYQAMIQDTEGNFWLGGDTALVRWAPTSQSVYRPPVLKSNSGQGGIEGLAAAPDGSLWVGIPAPGPGIEIAHITAGILRYLSSPQLHTKILAESSVDSLYLDRRQALWIGTTTNGIYRIYKDQVEHFGTAEGLSGDKVWFFLEDREGNLWVLSTRGVDCFRELSVTSFSPQEGLTSQEVDAVLASKNGGIWIGGAGALELLDHGHVRSILAGHGLPGSQVTSLFEDHAGRLWVGIDDGLTVYEGGRFRRISRKNGTPTGMIVGITEDAAHDIWVESKGPGRPLIHIRDFLIVEELTAPPMPPARRVAADPAGGLWLGLMSGDLARIQQGRVETFHYQHAQDSRVNQVTVNPDGSVLGATAFGLLGWRNGKQLMLTVRNGLPCDDVYSFVADRAGDLWLNTQCGLVKITKDEIQQWWEDASVIMHPKLLDVLDGAQSGSAPFQGSAMTPDGRLWFATGYYLQTIDPNDLVPNRLPPPVHVEDIVADRRTYPTPNGLVLPALTRDLEIEYTALSFVNPQTVRFRYKLEGRDTTWQDPGIRRQAFYSDLKPGSYGFRVIASNNNGVWNNEGATLNFTVLPAWFQTGWFRASCIGAFALLLWTIYQLRVQQLHRRFVIGLEAQVSERTRIARELHDTLLQSLHGLMFQFQGARNLLPRRPDDAMRSLDEAIGETKKALAESRDAIQGLRLEPMATGNLADLLMSASRELANSEPGPVPPVFDLVEEGDQQMLSSATRNEICRTALEVLRNAYRHAHARRIEAEIRYGDQMVRLRIRDDGRGIDPDVLEEGGRAGHWGLRGIRERAERIGANVEFWSELGKGTEVELAIPAAVAYENTRDSYRTKLFRKVTSRAHRS